MSSDGVALGGGWVEVVEVGGRLDEEIAVTEVVIPGGSAVKDGVAEQMDYIFLLYQPGILYSFFEKCYKELGKAKG